MHFILRKVGGEAGARNLSGPRLKGSRMTDETTLFQWRHGHVWLLIAWPAFLSACLLELLVFAAVDPVNLYGLDWPRNAVYSVAFFLFWAACALAVGLATALRPAQTVRQVPGAFAGGSWTPGPI